MLITPAIPKMTAKPIAEITKIAATLMPIRNCEISAWVIEYSSREALVKDACSMWPRSAAGTILPPRGERSLSRDCSRPVLFLGPGLLQTLKHILIGEVTALVRVEILGPRVRSNAVF